MKKIISLLLTVSILISSLSLFSFANTSAITDAPVLISEKAVSNEPTSQELERIIKKVKPLLDVPDELTEFDWRFNAPTYYSTSSWHLTWSDKDGNKRVFVNCDNNGNISNYSYNDYLYDRKISLPVFSKDALSKMAFEFLEKLCTLPSKSLKLVNSYSQSLYSSSFIYEFIRFENGVVVPDNTATVEVDYLTGKPVRLNCNFNYGLEFDNENNVSANDAKKTLYENQNMNLSYRLKNEYDDNGNIITRKAYLVYSPEISYLSVDAKTGKVYKERNTWTVNDKFAGSGALNGAFDSAESESVKGERGEYVLSEEELAKLELLNTLISRSEAIDIVLNNPYLYINKDANAVEATLTKKEIHRPYIISDGANNEGETQDEYYQWNLYFSAPSLSSSKEQNYFNPYMNAVVDAQNGKLISFSTNLPGYNYYINEHKKEQLPEFICTDEKAADIFTSFANEIIPEKVKDTRVSDYYGGVVINYTYSQDGIEKSPVYRQTNVNLVRVNEGIDFTYNNISGAVDKVTGKVTRFSYNWYDNVEFESPKDAITPKDAYYILLDSDGFGLNYEINSSYTYNKYLQDSANSVVDIDKLYTTETYSRLVYSGYNYTSTLVSAIDGKIINYSGEEIKDDYDFSNYSDISSHWAESDINILSDLGFGFEEGVFKPDESIKAEEFTNLMNFFGLYAREYNISPETNTSLPITRTEAVKRIIDAKGYYKIACMTGIFVTDFADNSDLLPEDVGFIAIARGFGLVKGDMGSFRPYDNLTRAEAVTLVLNFIRISE